MKSHIQVPRFLMKRFSHRTLSLNSRQQPVTRDFVYCLHLQNLSITEEDIKELNVQEGYYDKVAEDTLAKIESEFGEMVADLKISLNDKSKKFCVDKYELIIQKFALMTLARSSTMATMVKTGKLVFDDGFWNTVLPNYKPFLGVMNKNFVLPKCCFYSVQFETDSGRQDVIVLPVMPQIAILLIETSYREQFIKDNTQYIGFYSVADSFNMNIFAYFAETKHDNDFLIAENREDFDDILHFIAKH